MCVCLCIRSQTLGQIRFQSAASTVFFATARERQRLAREDKQAERLLRGPVLQRALEHATEARRQSQAAAARAVDDAPLPVNANVRKLIAERTQLAEMTGAAVTAQQWTALNRSERAERVAAYLEIHPDIRMAHDPRADEKEEEGRTSDPVTLARMAALPAWAQIELGDDAADVKNTETNIESVRQYIKDAEESRAPDAWAQALRLGLALVNAALQEEEQLRLRGAAALVSRRPAARRADALLVTGGGWDADARGGRVLLRAVDGLRRMLGHPSIPPPDLKFPEITEKKDPDDPDAGLTPEDEDDGTGEGGVRALLRRAKRSLARCREERARAEKDLQEAGGQPGCAEHTYFQAAKNQEETARKHLENLIAQARD